MSVSLTMVYHVCIRKENGDPLDKCVHSICVVFKTEHIGSISALHCSKLTLKI